MAAGDGKLFNEYVLKERKGDTYSAGDAWTGAFISNTFASISADLANPNLASVTVTSGGNVAASYLLASPAFTRATNVIKFDATDLAKILKSATNPVDVRCFVVYNATSVNDDLVQIHDLTANGTTAIDLSDGAEGKDLTFNFGAAGINTATV